MFRRAAGWAKRTMAGAGGKFSRVTNDAKVSLASVTGALKQDTIGRSAMAYLPWMGVGATTNLTFAAGARIAGNEDVSLVGSAVRGAAYGGLARGGRDLWSGGKKWHAGVKRHNMMEKEASRLANVFGYSGGRRMPENLLKQFDARAYSAAKELGHPTTSRRTR